jgi:hypothetical protein
MLNRHRGKNMWLFTKNSFVSVVQHRQQPHNVLVRARDKNHVALLFPKKQIHEDAAADYRYRLVVPKKEFARAVSDYILQTLDYDNFKAAQSADDPEWTRFLHAVWTEGLRLQR